MRTSPGRTTALMAYLVLLSCGAEHQTSPSYTPPEPLPLVVIVVTDDGPSSAELPWTLSDGALNVSAAMITPDVEPGPERMTPEESIIQEALEADMLIALIDAGELPENLDRDHIRIVTEPVGSPSSSPPEISEDLPDSVWKDHLLRQAWIVGMIDIYLPDLTVIGVQDLERAEMIGFLRAWTLPETLAELNLVIMRPSSETGPERGWAVIGGGNVSGTPPNGLTPGVLLSTMELFCGLDWESGVPGRIPALDILLELPRGWSPR